MFAIDSQSEALFASGWPHLRVLVSPHPHEKDPAKWALKALEAYDPDVYHVEWPREVAYRYVRAMEPPGSTSRAISIFPTRTTSSGGWRSAVPSTRRRRAPSSRR